MDCIWQIWRQLPSEFEYSDTVLILLVYAQLSRYTGDYVYDNIKEYEKILICMRCCIEITYVLDVV